MSFASTLPVLRRIPLEGLRAGVQPHYSPGVAPPPFDREKYQSYSPIRFVIRDSLERQPKNKLTWSFATHTSTSQLPLAVMRNRLGRRWNEAMRAALKYHGFECDGRRPAPAPGKPRADGIKGTLVVVLLNATGFNEPEARLFHDASKIVRALDLLSREASNGIPGYNRPQGSSQMKEALQRARYQGPGLGRVQRSFAADPVSRVNRSQRYS